MKEYYLVVIPYLSKRHRRQFLFTFTEKSPFWGMSIKEDSLVVIPYLSKRRGESFLFTPGERSPFWGTGASMEPYLCPVWSPFGASSWSLSPLSELTTPDSYYSLQEVSSDRL
jgi:hypothetical protein